MLFGEGTDLTPQELPQITLGGRRGRVYLALREGLEEPDGDPCGGVGLSRGICAPGHSEREITDRPHEDLDFLSIGFHQDLFTEPYRVSLIALEVATCPEPALKRGQQLVEELGLP